VKRVNERVIGDGYLASGKLPKMTKLGHTVAIFSKFSQVSTEQPTTNKVKVAF